MYKVTAIKNNNPVEILRLEVEKGKIISVHFKYGERGKITWLFPEEFDNFEIKEE